MQDQISANGKHRWVRHFNRVERRISTPNGNGISDSSSHHLWNTATSPGQDGGVDPADGKRSEDATSEHLPKIVNRTLAAAREQLGMDVAFVSEFADGQMVFRALEGESGSFSLAEGTRIPLEETFCQRMVDGRLPNAVPDAQNNEVAKDLEATRDLKIGSYIGVPLRFSDGRLYGTMCCLSHTPNPALRERDVELLGLLARLILEQLEQREQEIRRHRLQVCEASIDALIAALDARDDYTGEHSQAVVSLSSEVARRMRLTRSEVEKVEWVAMLHDIGKIGIPDSILNNPGPLDEREWRIMREHPKIGERIVASVDSLSHLAPYVRAEHEHWDGKGYPTGLSGGQIPLLSRIVLACDAFHAMISDRPYREAMSVFEAVDELKRNAGGQFCPLTVPVLIEIVSGSCADGRRPAAM